MMSSHFIFLSLIIGSYISLKSSSGCRVIPFGLNGSRCCSNCYEEDGNCLECPAGIYGISCSAVCPEGYYGKFCSRICNCSTDQICRAKDGCVSIPRSIKTTDDHLNHVTRGQHRDDRFFISGLMTSLVSMMMLTVICVLLYKQSRGCSWNVFKILKFQKRDIQTDEVHPTALPGGQKAISLVISQTAASIQQSMDMEEVPTRKVANLKDFKNVVIELYVHFDDVAKAVEKHDQDIQEESPNRTYEGFIEDESSQAYQSLDK